MERRLAAILAADIVGYSRLIGLDEEGALDALGGLRRDVIGPTVAAHHGRIVKFLGDGFLAEFSSVLDAFGAGLRIQKKAAQRNSNLPEERHIRHRIGVHQGDVIIQDDDVYGDTVNIAARLEGLADSEKAYGDVAGRMNVEFYDLGFQDLKNIRTPVRVYRARLSLDDVESTIEKRIRFPDRRIARGSLRHCGPQATNPSRRLSSTTVSGRWPMRSAAMAANTPQAVPWDSRDHRNRRRLNE